MTTTVTIGITGNKAVKITTPNGAYSMLPGRFYAFSIHGEQSISVEEMGDFLTIPESGSVVERLSDE